MAAPPPEDTHPLLAPSPPPSPSFAVTRCRPACLIFIPALLLSAPFLFLLWPSDPNLSIVRLRLDRVHVDTSPSLALDVDLSVRVRVLNRNFLSLAFRSIVSAVSYRGTELGYVESAGGRVRARHVSYVDAELRLDGAQVIHDALHLIEDYAKGAIPFDTVTKIDGRLHLFFLEIPVQGRISCSINVNAHDQTVVHQDCYPE